MKKLLLGSALLLSFSAFAGDYEDAAKLQKYCMEQGDWAGQMYDSKINPGEGTRQLAALDRLLARNPGSSYSVATFRMITEYAFFEATSRADAYTRGWAICMDR